MVDISQVNNRSKEDLTRHRFYLVNKNVTQRKDGTRDTSHATLGGMTSEIYIEHHNSARVYAHEYGHWLGLEDLYRDLTITEKGKTTTESRPLVPNNIMGAGTGVNSGQIFHIKALAK